MKHSPRVTLRPTAAVDWALIASWLARPDIRRWWASHASTVAGVRLALATPSAVSRIVEVDGQAAGYGHAIDAACLGEPFPDEMPAGTWDAGLFVADPRCRGRDVGFSALDLLTQEVFGRRLPLPFPFSSRCITRRRSASTNGPVFAGPRYAILHRRSTSGCCSANGVD